MRRLVVVPLVAALLLLAGCSMSGSGASSSGNAAPGGAVAQDAGGSPEKSADGASTDSRQRIITGSVLLTVDDPIAAAGKAAAIVESAGGRVDARSEYPAAENRQPSATLTLRIPADSLTATLDRIKDLGTVKSDTTSSKDVTTTVRDLDARITALKTSVDRLLELMSKATDTGDLLAIESALSQRQADLESLQSQRKVIGDQVDLATITLQLDTETTVATTVPGDFWSGLQAGWNALLVAGAGFLVFLGVALPWLALLALAGAIVWIIVRARRHRGAEG